MEIVVDTLILLVILQTALRLSQWSDKRLRLAYCIEVVTSRISDLMKNRISMITSGMSRMFAIPKSAFEIYSIMIF